MNTTNPTTTIKCWVELYSDSMYSWALHKTSDKETAEDLVQDTFLAAVQAFDSFKGESNPKTWLFSILNRKIIDHYRKSAHSLLRFENKNEKESYDLTNSFFDRSGAWESHTANTWSDEEGFIDNPEFSGTMKKCMNDLPGNWKEIISSKYLLEKDSKEICQELEITPSNYWQILHRAKLMLKKCLEINWFNK
ncbi:MAG: sigma-70 family RNA polymerase sigma factor [Bacteroidia bacterium]